MKRLIYSLLALTALIALAYHYSPRTIYDAKAFTCKEYGIVNVIGPVAGSTYAISSTGAAIEIHKTTKIGDTICFRYQ